MPSNISEYASLYNKICSYTNEKYKQKNSNSLVTKLLILFSSDIIYTMGLIGIITFFCKILFILYKGVTDFWLYKYGA